MADHAHAHAHDDHAHDGQPHHYDYVKIWGVLLALLVVSVAGPMLEIQIVTLITAFGIAFVKAYIVVRYFMHLNVAKPVVHYFLATALAFMVLFFAAVSPDVMNHEGTNWDNVAAKAETARALAETTGGHGDAHGAGHAPAAPAPGGH